MNYTIIDEKPENERDYVGVRWDDIPEEFIKSLASQLKRETSCIKTPEIPIEYAEKAFKQAETAAYDVMMMRVQVNFGQLGTAHSKFYFALIPKKLRTSN